MTNHLKVPATLLRPGLGTFITKSFEIVNPGTEFLRNWHIDLIAEYLTACSSGEITRLIINMPPRALKSICVSVAWPAWLLGNDPTRRIIAASYSQALALRHSLDTRLVMQSETYHNQFPDTCLLTGQNQKNKFVTTQHGYRYATSVGGSLTGQGGNFLILDDPHNPMHLHSAKLREHTINWFRQTFSTRLDDKKRGVFVIVMQRLHEQDLTGYLLEKGGWEHLCLPAVAEVQTKINFRGIDIVRPPGHILHPAREDKEELQRAQDELGAYAYAAQYQQRPIPLAGGMVQASWFRRYSTLSLLRQYTVQSWDTAIAAGKQSDYSVCTTWALVQEGEAQGYYLLDVLRERLEYPGLRRAVIRAYENYKPDVVLIEQKSSGQSLMQDLLRETGLPLLPVIPKHDKITRLGRVSVLMEAGRVFLPQSAAWLAEYEMELLSFPTAAHDDQVDSTTQALEWMKEKHNTVLRIRPL